VKEITIIFTKSKKFLPVASWAIRLWTWKSYSHVAKKHEVRDWGTAYYQASGGSVNYEYNTVFNKKHKIVKQYTLLIKKEIVNEINKECFKDAGKKYGIMQNVGIVLVDIFRIFGKKIDNPFKSGRNCSELIYSVVLKNLKPELDYDPDIIKPHEIENIIKEDLKDYIISNN